MLKGQITLENMIILGSVIAITLFAVSIMFSSFPHTPNSYSTTIELYQAVANASSVKIYLSKTINLPTSITLYYEPSNFSKLYSFSFANCKYKEELFSSFVVYTFFYNSSNCNIHVFNGSYTIVRATYYENGISNEFKLEDSNIGYRYTPTVFSSSLTLSPSIVQINGTVNAIISTNIKNATYTLFLNNYIIPTCENINVIKSSQCSFVASPSIGVIATNSFYVVNAYIYNSTVNEKVNSTLFIS